MGEDGEGVQEAKRVRPCKFLEVESGGGNRSRETELVQQKMNGNFDRRMPISRGKV